MEVVSSHNGQSFSLRGTCPFPNCNLPSVFVRIQSTEVSRSGQWVRIVGVFQCQACLKYILGTVEQQPNTQSVVYSEHYPLGAPDETVPPEIPEHIAEDFKEALRCLWVRAYNATAEMCRRALEASCLELGAPKNKVLDEMIDWLEGNRKITPTLREAAHKIRLGGNRAAHPAKNGPTLEIAASEQIDEGLIEKIEKDHAEAIVEFTRHFFQHVYVVPKQLDRYDFSKPRSPRPQSTAELGPRV